MEYNHTEGENAWHVFWGIVIFLMICFAVIWLGDIRCQNSPEKCYECQDPRNRISNKLPDCPRWMLEQ